VRPAGSSLGGLTGANQFDDTRDNFDEAVVVLSEPGQQLDLVIGHEVQPIHIIPELVELAKRAGQRALVRAEQRSGHAVKLGCRIVHCR
jgi:hypothetical protein